MVPADDRNMIVSNIGITPDLSAIYTTTRHGYRVHPGEPEEGSQGRQLRYMERVRRQLRREIPDVQTSFQTGGLVDSVVNQGIAGADSTFASAR